MAGDSILNLDLEDENDVFKVLDEDNDSYLTGIKISEKLFDETEYCSEVDYSTRKEMDLSNGPRRVVKNFGTLCSKVESRYVAYRASLEERCAIVIQGCWRRFLDRRIFRRLRDLLVKYSGCNSSAILKFVNPREADLIDRASGTFIRFRFSGEIFPPIIVYKIFTNRPIVDLCGRDFSKSWKKRSSSKQAEDFVKRRICGPEKKEDEIVSIGGNKSTNNIKRYERVDRNDWRPFLDSFTVEKPQTLDLQANATKTFTCGTRTMRKRRLKLALIKRLYENGRRKELRERDRGED